MKIVHWNTSKEDQPMTGIKRYEDELFTNVKRLLEKEKSEWHLERIQRSSSKILGSTPVSWLFRYKCNDADIVHATNEVIAPTLYFRKPKAFIMTVHDLVPVLYPSTIKNMSDKIQWKLTPKALSKADKIIAISEFTKKEIVRITEADEDKIDVIYEGINHSKYYPMNKEECKKRFGLNSEGKHILVVASNEEHKKMYLAKKVFEKVKKQREDVKLIKSGYAEVLEGDGIINVGYVQEGDMPALFNSANLFLHTSEYEGFGLPVLEAMACGVPVVSGNKASIPEVVGNAGGMVDFDAEDIVEQFVNKILNCLDKGIDKKAVERSMEFSWEKTAEETIKVYEKLED